jgi:hypothetical protein
MEDHIRAINTLFDLGLGHNFKDMLSGGAKPVASHLGYEGNSIDWDKLRYNTLYRDYSFYESKFPKGYETIPGFDKVIELIAEKNQDNSPLKEIQEIYKETDECNEPISNNTK